MECPKCKAAIDDDSYYCDQCGSEIMMCPQCRAPRKGKRCTQCGSVLVPASAMGTAPTQQPQAAQPQQPQQTQAQPSPHTDQDFQDAFQRAFHPQQSQSPQQPQAAQPQAQPKPAAASRMVSLTAPGVAVSFVNDAIIGRTTGEYLSVFGADGYTSGRHAQLRLAPAGVWTITDLGSTNGTSIDGNALITGAPAALNVGSVVEIGSQKFRVE